MYKSIRTKDFVNMVVMLLYAVFTLFLVFHHEIWADEAQVWLIVKNLSLPELFSHLVNEGHPSFFYLLVMPFAKLGFPLLSMQIICWMSACGAVFLLLRYSPFSTFLKTAIILSSGFLYFFPVIARSYSILPLLVFGAAVLYKKLQKNPQKYAVPYALVLALCANTHVIMFGFVFVLFLYFVYDKFIKEKNFSKQNSTAVLILSVGLLAVVLQLFGTFSSNASIRFETNNVFGEAVKTFSLFFLNSVALVYKSVFEPMKVTFFAAFGAIVMFLIFILLQVQLWIVDRKSALLCFLALGFQFFIYIFSYKAMLYQTRIFSAYIIVIFCFWTALENGGFKQNAVFSGKKAMNILPGIFFLLTFFCGAHAAVLDVMFNYSAAKETAVFLEKNTPENAVIIPNIDAFGLAVYANAPDRTFYSLFRDRKIKYMVWYNPPLYADEAFSQMVEDKIEEKKFEKTYVLVSSLLDFQHLEKTLPSKYRLIFKSGPSIVTGESFRVYEFTGKSVSGAR